MVIPEIATPKSTDSASAEVGRGTCGVLRSPPYARYSYYTFEYCILAFCLVLVLRWFHIYLERGSRGRQPVKRVLKPGKVNESMLNLTQPPEMPLASQDNNLPLGRAAGEEEPDMLRNTSDSIARL